MNIKLGFILSFIAGLSTLIGSVFIFFNNKKKDNIIISSLAFASGVMSFVSFFDLIPEAFNILNKSYNNIFSLINILLLVLISLSIIMALHPFLIASFIYLCLSSYVSWVHIKISPFLIFLELFLNFNILHHVHTRSIVVIII